LFGESTPLPLLVTRNVLVVVVYMTFFDSVKLTATTKTQQKNPKWG
jgi:hypothetical protein